MKKCLNFFVSLWALSMAVFLVARLAPGDPLTSYYGERAEKMSPQERSWAEAKLGLDDPLPVQYARWLGNALHGDLGISYKYKTDVVSVIGGRIGNTLLLGLSSFALIFVLSLGLGAFCAWKEERLPDRLICRVGTILGCLPEFWLSLVLLLVFSVWLKWFPTSGAYSIGGDGGLSDRLRHLVLPLAASVSGHLWYYAYLVRNRLLEEVRAEYVLLARAKGLGKGRVFFGHCLPNILPSYINLMAISAPHFLGGTYVIETVFSYPGLGTLAYESARYRDYPLLMAVCLLTGAFLMSCNFLAQGICRRIDPRLGTEDGGRTGEVTEFG